MVKVMARVRGRVEASGAGFYLKSSVCEKGYGLTIILETSAKSLKDYLLSLCSFEAIQSASMGRLDTELTKDQKGEILILQSSPNVIRHVR